MIISSLPSHFLIQEMEMAEAQSNMKKEQNVWYLLFLVSFTFNILMLVTHSYKLLASKRMLEAG